MRDLVTSPQFERDLRRIPADIRNRADRMIAALLLNPTDPALRPRKLQDIHPDVWRVRLGDYRLLYLFSQTSLTLLHLRHRREVYRNL